MVGGGGMKHQVAKESVTGHFATALIRNQKGVSSALRMSATNASLTASEQKPGGVNFWGQSKTQGNDGIADNHGDSRIAAVHSNVPKGRNNIAVVDSNRESVSRFHAAIDSSGQRGEGAVSADNGKSERQARADGTAPAEEARAEESAPAEETRAEASGPAQRTRATAVAPANHGSAEVETSTVQLAAPTVNAYSSLFPYTTHMVNSTSRPSY